MQMQPTQGGGGGGKEKAVRQRSSKGSNGSAATGSSGSEGSLKLGGRGRGKHSAQNPPPSCSPRPSAARTRTRSAPWKNRMTKHKAGLQFPVGRIHRVLKKGNYAQRVGAGAAVYLTAILNTYADPYAPYTSSSGLEGGEYPWGGGGAEGS
ncbi:hypothetical protein C8F04DRAFT_1198998 [Mycena alexandri]|uniref:Histone H2A n=1 Tax=Mycena alexandri TaxID=1745969 RepID=A0AAD6S069_9AGAR|nr:hypothetical protein C8F04DRAFT_1198998 [Mycena alexandri]